ncbi:MAG: adenosylcobinamide-GDP ribazoletransferase [Candidatus Lindowbacteria bacterium]|nr:adenosylcobinamide-GDP ribazoletransferase [Candidatus Lindowbacteria bacterium]
MMTGVKSFIAALRFLTIAPIPARWANEAEYLSRSVPLFPIVGLLIGAAIVTADFGMNLLFPSLLANGITVVALVAVSGGLHIDGLADTADGFFSSRPRERILEIMRDSRTGPMGVVAVSLRAGDIDSPFAVCAPRRRSRGGLSQETVVASPCMGNRSAGNCRRAHRRLQRIGHGRCFADRDSLVCIVYIHKDRRHDGRYSRSNV